MFYFYRNVKIFGTIHFVSDTVIIKAGIEYQLSGFFFVLPFYLQAVLVHSANCVKNVYSGM
jgi:hypothetical protein